MAADVTIYVGDTHTVPSFTFTDSAGNAVNLTGATVTARIEPIPSGTGAAGAGTPTVTAASAGTLTYTFGAADVTTAGDYLMQFKAVFGDASVMHSRYYTLNIRAAV